MRNTIGLVLCFLFAAAAINWAEEPQITLKVEPQISYIVKDEQVYRRIIIYIPRHEDNRNIRLEWDSGNGESGATERQLSGINSPYIIEGSFFFGKTGGLILTAGRYVVRATLTRGGKKFSTIIETNIILVGEGS